MGNPLFRVSKYTGGDLVKHRRSHLHTALPNICRPVPVHDLMADLSHKAIPMYSKVIYDSKTTSKRLLLPPGRNGRLLFPASNTSEKRLVLRRGRNGKLLFPKGNSKNVQTLGRRSFDEYSKDESPPTQATEGYTQAPLTAETTEDRKSNAEMGIVGKLYRAVIQFGTMFKRRLVEPAPPKRPRTRQPRLPRRSRRHPPPVITTAAVAGREFSRRERWTKDFCPTKMRPPFFRGDAEKYLQVQFDLGWGDENRLFFPRLRVKTDTEIAEDEFSLERYVWVDYRNQPMCMSTVYRPQMKSSDPMWIDYECVSERDQYDWIDKDGRVIIPDFENGFGANPPREDYPIGALVPPRPTSYDITSPRDISFKQSSSVVGKGKGKAVESAPGTVPVTKLPNNISTSSSSSKYREPSIQPSSSIVGKGKGRAVESAPETVPATKIPSNISKSSSSSKLREPLPKTSVVCKGKGRAVESAPETVPATKIPSNISKSSSSSKLREPLPKTSVVCKGKGKVVEAAPETVQVTKSSSNISNSSSFSGYREPSPKVKQVKRCSPFQDPATLEPARNQLRGVTSSQDMSFQPSKGKGKAVESAPEIVTVTRSSSNISNSSSFSEYREPPPKVKEKERCSPFEDPADLEPSQNPASEEHEAKMQDLVDSYNKLYPDGDRRMDNLARLFDTYFVSYRKYAAGLTYPIKDSEFPKELNSHVTFGTNHIKPIRERRRRESLERRQQKKDEEAKRKAQLRKEAEAAARQAAKDRLAEQKAREAAEEDAQWVQYMGREKVPSGTDLITGLSGEWQQEVWTAMSKPWSHEVATVSNGTSLTRRDFGKVLPQAGTQDDQSGWLNDEIVSAYLQLAIDYGLDVTNHRRGQTPIFHAFNSFFYKKLSESGPEGVKRWASKAKIGGKALLNVETLFIPVNTGLHWTLLVVSPTRRVIEYFDSLSRGNVRAQAPLINNIKRWLQNELEDAYVASEWKVKVVADGPQQNNSSDCGVFAVTTAKMIMCGWDPRGAYDASHIPTQRKRILAELIQGNWHDEFRPKMSPRLWMDWKERFAVRCRD